jgi:hypothetical protein
MLDLGVRFCEKYEAIFIIAASSAAKSSETDESLIVVLSGALVF